MSRCTGRSKAAPSPTVKRRPPVIPNAGRNTILGDRPVTENENWASGPDLETRRRRAAYRANHRGTKEMDWLVGRFADAHLDDWGETALAEFEQFLELPDPELQKWILEPGTGVGDTFVELIASIRAFHGLAQT